MTVCGWGRGNLVTPLFVAALALVLSGCEVTTTPKAGNSTATPPGETGENAKPAATQDNAVQSAIVTAEGSSTVYPICQAFAVEFEKKSKHKVSLGRQGTGGGYKKFVKREADIWNASRLIADTEAAELNEKGIQWLQLDIAMDGIVIAVNPKNTWCTNLTCAQLKQIWEPNSKIATWQDLDSTWPPEPILLYGADTESGTFEYFTEVINGAKKASTTKYTPASDDNLLVQGIASNKGALGYIPFGYYIEHTETLRAVGISPTKDGSETPKPFVEPSVETILSQEYAPLSRPLFMYVNKASLKRVEVADFLKYALSDEAQPLLEKSGFVRMKDEVRRQSNAALDAALKELQ